MRPLLLLFLAGCAVGTTRPPPLGDDLEGGGCEFGDCDNRPFLVPCDASSSGLCRHDGAAFDDPDAGSNQCVEGEQ